LTKNLQFFYLLLCQLKGFAGSLCCINVKFPWKHHVQMELFLEISTFSMVFGKALTCN